MAPAGLAQPGFWIAVILGAAGLALSVWTVRLFRNVGKGTPAPWAPPKRLVVRGSYRHVRNPMIVSVLLMLGAESLFFGSWHLAGWALVFFLGNSVYFSLVEGPALERRFGDDYRLYKTNVPRWIPKLRPSGLAPMIPLCRRDQGSEMTIQMQSCRIFVRGERRTLWPFGQRRPGSAARHVGCTKLRFAWGM